jgi:hypothetical protein
MAKKYEEEASNDSNVSGLANIMTGGLLGLAGSVPDCVHTIRDTETGQVTTGNGNTPEEARQDALNKLVED